MLKINNFYLNYSKLHKDFRYRISDTDSPVFSWAAISSVSGAYQSAYRIMIASGENLLWDSEKVESSRQSVKYTRGPLPVGVKLDIRLVIWDNFGNESAEYNDYFYIGVIDNWNAEWIAYPNETGRNNIIFKKNFEISDIVDKACLFVCGLGYHN
ncbi:MAG: hypothetical protein FWF15_09250, partial [Oscillospiraceae bacterium]|nr:hypothetical protein [Oscillospiraceae bacterium]